MGGENPYISKADIQLPKKGYKITFVGIEIGPDKTVAVDPEKIPYGPTGQPGSLLDIALNSGVEIEHSCGGVVACSTCHVLVKEGLDTCNEATDDELDQLDEAPGITLQSRLACQCVPNGTQDLVVEIPSWNKNLVKEGH
ncbi:MAG TPA: 2Fe-2S iron-sulfur cluster-binding protein [Nitrospiria bacterium]|jgi:2Fe-2S ferredoxin